MSENKPLKIANVIAITSGKGGVGKSNIAVNLSIRLAKSGYKVCLFDADINLANINILIAVNPRYTLQHLFSDNKTINDIILKTPSGFDLIAGASGISEFTCLDQQKQQRLLHSLQQLEQNYDYLILDTAAGIDDSVLNFLHAVPHLLLVLTKEPTSLTDAFSLLKILKKQAFKGNILVLVNMVISQKMAKHIFTRFSDAVTQYIQFKVYFAGYIIMDDCMSQSVEQQSPLLISYPDCPASICIHHLADRLINGLEKTSVNKKTFSHYFSSLLNETKGEKQDLKNELLEKMTQLSSTEANEIYHKLEQLLDKKPLQKELELQPREQKSTITQGLRQALVIARQINVKC